MKPALSIAVAAAGGFLSIGRFQARASPFPILFDDKLKGGSVDIRRSAQVNATSNGCYQVSYADYRFAGLFNQSAPWLPQCTGCAQVGEQKCYENPCWCIPEGGNNGCCPDPGERPIQYDWQVAMAFKANIELSDPITLEPAGCDPWETNLELYPNLTLCTEFPGANNSNAVCAFMYSLNDTNCGGLDAREYSLQTFSSYEEAVAAGGVVTHFGSCGVCSNAYDLGVMMDPRTVYDGRRVVCGAMNSPTDVSNAPNQTIREGGTFQCYKDMGFSDQCAYLHASSDIAARNCTTTCFDTLGNPGYVGTDYDTCLFNACVRCQEDIRAGGKYLKWAGRDLNSSRIIAYNQFYHLKYPCSIYQDDKIINQDPYAKAKSSNQSIGASTSESADRFVPSYNVLVNPETCSYVLKFTMKHDPTLPIAGGSNTSLQNAVDPHEYERLCNEESKEIANDGKPYRERRKYLFQFGDDVKAITGLFDHMSIDFNPCGHHPEEFFGRTHYEFSMYAVSEEWRTIMNCDTTPCYPQDCKFDIHFQSNGSGKAFFEMDTCLDPFPDYIPPEAVRDIKPGSFNKNMPLGFFTFADTGLQHSGVHSQNIATVMGWNDTQVSTWTYPILSMASFANAITAYKSMIPVEFVQGIEQNSFTSPETPPLCQTNMGLPLTYTVSYDAQSGYTTFEYIGISPSCACTENAIAAEIVTQAQCDAHEAEMKKYSDIYQQSKGSEEPMKVPQGYFGKFNVSEVEEAFGLNSGSLILPGSEGYACLSSNNYWTSHIGTPLALERFVVVAKTPRNSYFDMIAKLSTPLFQYKEDKFYEHHLLGCFYRPKNDNITQQLKDNDAALCTNDTGSLTGTYFEYQVVAYVDENTRLLYYGYNSSFADDAQVLTQFVLQKSRDYKLEGKEIYAHEYFGPSGGDYESFADLKFIQDINFLGNFGQFIITLAVADLTAPCPEDYCGSIVPNFIPNPLAPNASWPKVILDNKCDWFPCMDYSNCTKLNCTKYTPGKCAAYESVTNNGTDENPGPSATEPSPTAPSPVLPTTSASGLARASFIAVFIIWSLLSMIAF